MDINKHKNLALSKKRDFQRMASKLRKQNSKKLDNVFGQLHVLEFEEINCLECANCCKSPGPRLTKTDIDRLSKSLKHKSSEFYNKYIKIDEDNDYVFKSMPCPFLGEDNFCFVYSDRPKACREYPHTDRKNVKGILSLCVKNTEICPAVYNIFIKLEEYFSDR